VRTLAEHDLADEYRLIVHPTMLGSGTPLFQGVAQRRDLQLVRTTQLGSQLVVLCYEPKRP
jgi:riboflavin biosynthesis pyrimidine reductase